MKLVYNADVKSSAAAAYGIAQRHWTDLQTMARQEAKILLVRGGKPAAVPWIERNFPAKPRELGDFKVDPVSGLLRVHSATDKAKLFSKGSDYWVLESDSGQPQGVHQKFRVVHRHFVLNDKLSIKEHDWAIDGAVILKSAMLPITSDYDLAAILDVRDSRWGKTFLADVSNFPNRTSMFTEPVIQGLNQKMNAHRFGDDRKPGLDRFMHGTNAQYNGAPTSAETDVILAFFPSGQVEMFRTTSVEHARNELLAMLQAHAGAT